MQQLCSIFKENETRQKNIEYLLSKAHSNDNFLESLAKKIGFKTDFNETFWKFPTMLWHCTHPDNLLEILQNGLLAQHKSRGIENRHIRHAVFTTMESEEIGWNQHSYGTGVIEINTRAMKADGVVPHVSMEPDWERALLLAAVYTKLTKKEHFDEQFISRSEGTSKFTVIIHGYVPAKYLKEA